MNKTAVDLLVNELNNHPSFHGQFFKELFEQAKEIEKQQISNAYQIGIIDGLNHQPRDYYNETFKTK